MTSSTLERFVRDLASEEAFDTEKIRNGLPNELRHHLHNESFLKLLLNESKRYRLRLHFGRLRALLFIGTALRGDTFLLKFERAGLLLCDGMPNDKFFTFLVSIQNAVERTSDPNIAILRERVGTYIAYSRMSEE